MKIYEIGTGYTPIPATMGAATEIVVEELTKAFQKLGEAVQIVDIAAECRAPSNLPIREVKVPGCFSGTDVQLGIMHKLKRVVYSVALAGELKRILKQETEPVVLHFHNQYNLFFFLKLVPRKVRRKAFIAYSNHSGIWGMDWAEIEGTIRKRYFQEAECMKQADLLFVLNEKTKENAVQHLGVSEDKICRIRNGVNTNLYRPLSKVEKQQNKEKLGLSGRKVIVQVGSVCENKGQIRSLSYLLPLMKRDPAVTYVFAGGIVDMSYYQQLQQWVHDNNAAEQVHYCGVLQPGEELNALYNTAHISMLFSGYDAFPLVTVESAAAGVPMLTGENIPVFLDESVSYIPSENVTDKIESLLYSDEEEYAELCRRVRENAVRNYSWEKVAEVYLTQFKAKGC